MTKELILERIFRSNPDYQKNFDSLPEINKNQVEEFAMVFENVDNSFKDRHIRKLKLYIMQKGVCAVCKNIMKLEYAKGSNGGRYATFEHIVPVSKGGNWDRDNIVLTCGSPCNSKRGNMDFEQFKAMVASGVYPKYRNDTIKTPDEYIENILSRRLSQELYLFFAENPSMKYVFKSEINEKNLDKIRKRLKEDIKLIK